MSSSTCGEIAAVLDGLDGEAERLCELSFEASTTAELLGVIDRVERIVRKLAVPGHAVINQLALAATNAELCGTLGQALSNRLRINKSDANQRITQTAAANATG